MPEITVITGGSTPERNVALAGAGLVAAALRSRGLEVVVVDTWRGPLDARQEEEMLDPTVGLEPPSAEELATIRAEEDVVGLVALPELTESEMLFLVLHGRQGEGGELQALFEMANLAFVGSDAVGSLLAMDKDVAKRLFRQAGLDTPDWILWPAPQIEIEALGWPLVVKPSRVGSTIGLTLVEHPDQLEAAVDEALRYDDEVLLESFVAGRELTVGVLGDQALAVGEIRPAHAIFDYECKYTPGMSQEIFPAEIEPELAEECRRLALAAHRTLKLRDFSRVDFRVDDRGVAWCLEANTLPGMTPTSLLPQSAAAVGIPYDELCHRICELARRRERAAERRLVDAGGSTS